MREIELKGVVPDEAAARQRVEAAGGELSFAGRLEDRRYDDAAGRLAPRDLVLRLRTYRDPDGRLRSAHLDWKGPTQYENGYKVREELSSPVADPDVMATILGRLGYTVIREIDRDVSQYTLGGAMVRFERYPRMDVLVEVEGSPGAIEQAIGHLGAAALRVFGGASPGIRRTLRSAHRHAGRALRARTHFRSPCLTPRRRRSVSVSGWALWRGAEIAGSGTFDLLADGVRVSVPPAGLDVVIPFAALDGARVSVGHLDAVSIQRRCRGIEWCGRAGRDGAASPLARLHIAGADARAARTGVAAGATGPGPRPVFRAPAGRAPCGAARE